MNNLDYAIFTSRKRQSIGYELVSIGTHVVSVVGAAGVAFGAYILACRIASRVV